MQSTWPSSPKPQYVLGAPRVQAFSSPRENLYLKHSDVTVSAPGTPKLVRPPPAYMVPAFNNGGRTQSLQRLEPGSFKQLVSIPPFGSQIKIPARPPNPGLCNDDEGPPPRPPLPRQFVFNPNDMHNNNNNNRWLGTQQNIVSGHAGLVPNEALHESSELSFLDVVNDSPAEEVVETFCRYCFACFMFWDDLTGVKIVFVTND